MSLRLGSDGMTAWNGWATSPWTFEGWVEPGVTLGRPKGASYHILLYLTDIPQIPEGVEAMIGPLSFLGNDNRAPRAQ